MQASSHTTGDEHARDGSYLNPSHLIPFGQPLMRMTFDCKKYEHPLSTRASQVCNPTVPVGALAYLTADTIENQYLKRPGA